MLDVLIIIRDKYSSFFVGSLLSAYYLYFFWDKILPRSIDNFLIGAITISVGLSGFLLTSMSLIYALQERKIIKQLKQVNLYKQLVNCFFSAIRWNFGAFTLCMLELFLDDIYSRTIHNLLFSFVVFFFVQGVCLSLRSVDILSKTLLYDFSQNTVNDY
jgi:hypothetical protein